MASRNLKDKILRIKAQNSLNNEEDKERLIQKFNQENRYFQSRKHSQNEKESHHTQYKDTEASASIQQSISANSFKI